MTSSRPKWSKAALVLAASLLMVPAAFAQSDNAQLSGFVRDNSGAVIPGASVTIKNEATGLERIIQTNESGYYVVSSIPPGSYTVSVSAKGFKRFIQSQNRLTASIPITVDAVLQVGELADQVEVKASVANVQLESATVGRTVEARQILEMMLNGRNPLFLSQLKPGVRGGDLSSLQLGRTSGGLNINGARSSDYLITVDGAVATRTRGNGSAIGAADVETLAEMQILTANYNAEYGRSGGGQVRMVTKSGQRDFHGSFYDYVRNRVLDANSWTQNRTGTPKAQNNINQFGFVFSGPVFIPKKLNTDRNKLFFLVSEEWVERRLTDTTTQTVPSLKMRQGDFSELLDPSNRFFGRIRTINDPLTNTPFAGNIIPTSRLSPNGIAFLNTFPQPNRSDLTGSNNYFQLAGHTYSQRKDTVSIDYNPTPYHAVRLRYQKFNRDEVTPFRTGFDYASEVGHWPDTTASLNYVWTISPTLLNEVLVTASNELNWISLDHSNDRWKRSKYGITYPYIFPENKEESDRIPTVEISNFGSIDGNRTPLFSGGPIYVVADNMTKISGNHTLKWGASYERSGENDFDQIRTSGVPGGSNNQNGRFVFTDTRAGSTSSGLAIGNAAMGLFNTYAEIGQRAYTPYRAQMFEWFIQDSWKASRKLRIELGLRHTVMTPYYYSLWGNIAVFDANRYDPSKAAVQNPATGYIISGDRYNGIVIPGSGWPDAAKGRVAIADSGEFDRLFSGGPNYWGDRQWLNFQPRVGIAYQIGNDQKQVIRAGAGKFMAHPGVTDSAFLGGNPPFQPMVSIANGVSDTPGVGPSAAFPLFFATTDPTFKIPSSYVWNVSYEREVGFNTTVTLGYVGRVGLNLERTRNINELPLGTLFLPQNKGINTDVLRPYKGFSTINVEENSGRSEYNALQLEVNRRFSSGLSFGFGYTLSKSLDNASGRSSTVLTAYNDKIYWGPSDYDVRHMAVANVLYEIPLFKDRNRWTGKVLGGWQLSSILQLQTGQPFNVTTSNDFMGIGSTGAEPWNINGDPNLPRGDRAFSTSPSDKNYYFRTTNPDGTPIFTQPANGTIANQTRAMRLYNPGLQSYNAALFKEFAITERQHVQFRMEMFNFPNHPYWSGLVTNPTATSFGKVTSKSSNRNIQLSLRYRF
jgi:hypothetical protein